MTGSPQSADINASLMRADGKCPRSASNFGQTLPIPVPLNSSANIILDYSILDVDVILICPALELASG